MKNIYMKFTAKCIFDGEYKIPIKGTNDYLLLSNGSVLQTPFVSVRVPAIGAVKSTDAVPVLYDLYSNFRFKGDNPTFSYCRELFKLLGFEHVSSQVVLSEMCMCHVFCGKNMTVYIYVNCSSICDFYHKPITKAIAELRLASGMKDKILGVIESTFLSGDRVMVDLLKTDLKFPIRYLMNMTP